MADFAIEARGVSRRFGEIVAVDDLSLQVRAGEVFGFLGHNGAGKTTTVRLLNGVLQPDRGEARVLGLDPRRDGPALRARTGVVTESASLDARLTARDNLGIYADLFGVPRDEVAPRTEALLARFGLADRADDRVATYSTGMRQRLMLARALLHEPEIMFLDEPTAGLDPVAARQVHELIGRLAREERRTVFLCTHNLVEAQRLCDRVAVLEHGRLAALGTPGELARQFVRRLDVDIETDAEQLDAALRAVERAPHLIHGAPRRTNGGLALTVAGREAIPNLLALLVENGIRVYRAAAEEPSLEDVYFALHADREARA